MIKKQNIILFGYGTFGRQLYKNLIQSGHIVRVISGVEENVEIGVNEHINIEYINIRKNEDILSLNINPYEHIFYCALDKTANNLFLVLSLRTLFVDTNIIALSNSDQNSRKLIYAGATNVIDLYEATARRTVNMLTKPAVTKALDEIIYKENSLKMAEIQLPKNSFLEGKFVNDIIFKNMGIILIAIIDKELGNDLIFTDHRINHKLDAGDTLVIVSTKDNLINFKNKF